MNTQSRNVPTVFTYAPPPPPPDVDTVTLLKNEQDWTSPPMAQYAPPPAVSARLYCRCELNIEPPPLKYTPAPLAARQLTIRQLVISTPAPQRTPPPLSAVKPLVIVSPSSDAPGALALNTRRRPWPFTVTVSGPLTDCSRAGLASAISAAGL